MEFTIFFKGVIIGFALAVPIGPIGIMCIRKTLTEGRLRGLIIGLGAATADLIYGSIAAFGLTFISNMLFNQRIWIRLTGGLLFLLIGIKIFRTFPATKKLHTTSKGLIKTYLSTVFLTLTNPLTIFAFITVFAALGLGNTAGYLSTAFLVAGVFTGSCLWFLSLNTGAIFFKKKLNLSGLQWVNRIAGILIFISGVIAIGSLL